MQSTTILDFSSGDRHTDAALNEHITTLNRKQFEQRWTDIAMDELEVSGDYSVEELARKFLS